MSPFHIEIGFQIVSMHSVRFLSFCFDSDIVDASQRRMDDLMATGFIRCEEVKQLLPFLINGMHEYDNTLHMVGTPLCLVRKLLPFVGSDAILVVI